MRHWTSISGTALPILTALAAASLVPAARAQNPPQINVRITASREWTNDDVDQLRSEGAISYFSAEAASATTAASSEATFTPRPAQKQDPDWYAQQAATLQAELESRQAALAQYMQAIQEAKSRTHMNGGLSLDQGIVAATPEAGAEILQARVDETASRIDELADLARVNGIPPGALRG